jgi:GH43 family beta-xylosidase
MPGRALAAMAVLAGVLAPASSANPVLPGDHPDPSLVREADGWYAASTSGSWLPAFPVLHSRDLRRWHQVGSVLARRPGWAAGDFWAPELERRRGRVLAYYAARARDGRRCIAVASSTRMRGPFRDHGPLACSRTGEIDPLPVKDENGADWLVWKRDGNSRGRPTPILAAPLAPGGLALAGPARELFRADAAWERGLVEAPALFRRHGLFYIVYSAGRCCGLRCNYTTGVARSGSLLGPWEKRPEPLLQADPMFRCPGHGSIARGPGGLPLLAYHAYARGDSANRQMLIRRLTVPAEGWPELRRAVGVPARAPVQRFRFRRSRLGLGWQWLPGLRPATRVTRGSLVLREGVLARQARSSRFSTKVTVPKRRRGAVAGLAVMASSTDGLGLELRGRRAIAWRLDEGRRRRVGRRRIPEGGTLRIAIGSRARMFARVRGRWRRVGRPQPLPRWTSGPRVALTVRGPGRVRASFDELWIRPR